jgi:hypothetical protein
MSLSSTSSISSTRTNNNQNGNDASSSSLLRSTLEECLLNRLRDANAPQPPHHIFEYWLNECQSGYRDTQEVIIKKAKQINLMKQQLTNKRTFR